MGRPIAFDRERALGVAMNEIWRHGYAASSVNALATRMGITRSSFYHSFGDREALFREALSQYLSQAPDRGFATIPDDAPVLPAITRTVNDICRVRAADPDARGCLLLNCLSETAGRDDDIGAYLTEHVRDGIARLQALLQRAATQGELVDDGDLQSRALALQNLVIGINAMSRIIHDGDQLWSAARRTLSGLGLLVET